MSHIDLGRPAVMKPGPVIRYEIAQDQARAKRLLVAAVVASVVILVVAVLFLDLVR
jgi:hypothetical protein